MSHVIKKGHFSGNGKVFVASDEGLAAILRAVVADNAMLRVQNAIVAEDLTEAALTFTDNSTGVAGAVVADEPLPSAGKVVASGTDGAALAALNTAFGKVENGTKVVGTLVNQVRALVGLAAISFAAGTVATAGTIPAQDKTTGAGASGTSAADFNSAFTAFQIAKQNLKTLALAVNETLVAVGLTPFEINDKGAVNPSPALLDIPTVSAAAAGGLNALLKADADAFLTASANDLATIAAKWNAQKALISSAVPHVTLAL